MKRLFRGGTVVDGQRAYRADVLTEGEKIVRIAEIITDNEAEGVDCAGLLLLPGCIDAHTYLTSLAQLRGRACDLAWTCGTKRRRIAPVTMVST